MATDQWFRRRARELYAEDGQVEIDADAPVSSGSAEGGYVQAWVWVPLEEAKLEKP
jgi:hypothetical protein